MEFAVTKNNNDTWDLTPIDGPLTGACVATAEGLNLAGVRFNGRQMVGVIEAAWGLSIMYDDVDIDVSTLRGLGIGKRFDMRASEKVRNDSDGFKDTFTLRILKGAQRVVMLGSAIWTKGQY
jgi:hypothetical protein